MACGQLWRFGDGLVLLHAAAAVVGRYAQGVVCIDAQVIRSAQLLLLQRLARVVLRGHAAGLARVGLPLRPGQTLGILRAGARVVGHQGQLGIVRHGHHQFSVDQVAVCRTVVAPSVRQIAAGTDDIAHAAIGLATGFEAQALLAIAAHRHTGRQLEWALRVLGKKADHTARCIAIQRRVRAANHLHPVQAADVDIGGLALPIRHGGGDAIHQQAHTAHAKG